MRALLLATAVILAAAPAAAQPEQDFSKVEIRVEQLAPGVAVLFGSGGNIGLSYGADGNAIVDDQFAPLSDKIVAAIRTIDPDPVKFVINTHWHFDHSGGNENFGKSGSVILAQDNVRTRMSTEQVMKSLGRTFPPSPKEALPVVTFDDDVTLHLNGDTLHIFHVANAHTDGDAFIHWQNANVIHMGDTFPNVGLPFIDRESGGSIDGLIAAMETGLKVVNDRTRIITGHGPVASRADLVRYRDMLVDVRGKVAAGIKAGQTLAQIKASGPATKYATPGGFIQPDGFVEAVYESLRNPPAHGHSH